MSIGERVARILSPCFRGRVPGADLIELLDAAISAHVAARLLGAEAHLKTREDLIQGLQRRLRRFAARLAEKDAELASFKEGAQVEAQLGDEARKALAEACRLLRNTSHLLQQSPVGWGDSTQGHLDDIDAFLAQTNPGDGAK